ncbi:MAG TPA: lysylphosphatidylglycerol synthase transmembrane domain-containing protein [Pseudolabrys sp.]|nr:lysylphosphatidylglycerol synthase transmembrane domain-containing protein [Pseudolabrys sp.]
MSTDQFPGRELSKAEFDFRQLAIVVAKALISIGLIAFLASRLDYSRLLSYWRVLNGVWIVGAVAVLIVEMCAIAAVRLNLMLVYVDARRKLTTTMQIALCGFFFEQVTIGFVGGDAVRLWLLKRADVPLGRAIRALLLDRTCGFASLVLLSLLGIHALLPLVDEKVRSVIAGTLIVSIATGLVAVAVAFALTKLLPRSRLARFWERLGPQGQAVNVVALTTVFALAATTHLLNILVFWMLGQSLGLTMTLGQWFVVAPTVLLISMLPISVGGWGVREGAMVVALHGFGIPTEEAVLPSILFGLCIVTATLPGGIFWVISKNADK